MAIKHYNVKYVSNKIKHFKCYIITVLIGNIFVQFFTYILSQFIMTNYTDSLTAVSIRVSTCES